MNNSLGNQMLVAYGAHNARGEPLAVEYGVIRSEADREAFTAAVRRRFDLGVHSAYVNAILDALGGELGSQQAIAEVLGLKDRTSISHMMRSQTMDGIRITIALYQYSELIVLPTPRWAALFGFARATSYIKALAYGDESIEGTMSPQDFAYLVGVLACAEWDTAVRRRDRFVARGLAAEIVREQTLDPVRRSQLHEMRPEQSVQMLQAIRSGWADFGVLALWAIPEGIPMNA